MIPSDINQDLAVSHRDHRGKAGVHREIHRKGKRLGFHPTGAMFAASLDYLSGLLRELGGWTLCFLCYPSALFKMMGGAQSCCALCLIVARVADPGPGPTP